MCIAKKTTRRKKYIPAYFVTYHQDSKTENIDGASLLANSLVEMVKENEMKISRTISARQGRYKY